MLTENGVDARMGNMQLAVGTPTPTLGMLEQPSAIPYGWTDRQTPLLISPNTHQGESSPLTRPQMRNCETQTGGGSSPRHHGAGWHRGSHTGLISPLTLSVPWALLSLW